MKIKEVAIRAFKTFIQAFIPVLIASFKVADITDNSQIKAVGYTALISAVAAGLSAVWNLIVNANLFETKSEEETSSYSNDVDIDYSFDYYSDDEENFEPKG